ncbi:MAG: ribonucleotide-diphosphate reductase subunit beta [Candidatus Hydrogenedentes bacterium]|nr:ribonucleotide-diphosphate reductase subunit beta [Candidatus Hydrogenedentota bacterium]
MAINFDTLPLRAMRKGRELVWNPHEIDFTQDAKDWLELNADEQDLVIGQVFGFLIGERGVTHDLAPLQTALRLERGHMEEEMYITQQLFEESTHVEFFQLWMDASLPGKLGEEVPYPRGEPSPFFKTLLPTVMQALNTDRSPEAMMRATVTYHQIIEGVLAEIGYEIFYTMIDERGIFPGLRKGVRFIQQDEARHIAFGTYFAQRLIRDHPELEDLFVEEMEKLHALVSETSGRFFDRYGDTVPFGLEKDRFTTLSETLYQRRLKAVLKMGHVEV